MAESEAHGSVLEDTEMIMEMRSDEERSEESDEVNISFCFILYLMILMNDCLFVIAQ